MGLLSRCVETVAVSLEGIGFPRERRTYSPHITLGRVREDRSGGRVRSAVDRAESPAVGQSVDSIVVMSSVLSREGPAYSVVSRAKLACGE
jgi:2'-5' RNA ligase